MILTKILCVTTMTSALSVIPRPVEMQPGEGAFKITARTVIAAPAGLQQEAEFLAEAIKKGSGRKLSLAEKADAGAINLALDPTLAKVGDEGYLLTVTPTSIQITGRKPAGVFYGIQTLLQLLPPSLFAGTAKPEDLAVPSVSIVDYPRFRWRGLHLDVSRHYMPVDFIKKYIDLLAMHKMNTFHWHLTDDQGWRLEIKKYPKLTAVGARRDESPVRGNRGKGNGKPYGPFFYTQDEVREIVAYAQKRHITIVPEIEMPGHSVAALAAYPELGCTGGPYKVRTRWGIEDDVYCVGNDATFEFLENVLTEVMDLFPSEFIHIGGDECPKGRWNNCPKCGARMKAEGLRNAQELQSWFVKRIEKFLNERGRRLIGWDEILEGGLAPNAAVMSWRGVDGGVQAAESGHDVVMSPTSYCYFNYYEESAPGEPEGIGGHLPLKRVYSYDPIPAQLGSDKRQHVLGVQGNLWTEYMWEPKDVEYRAFPRACALAEVAWTPPERKNYADFRKRLAEHLRRLDGWEVNYRKSRPEPVVVGEWHTGETTETYAARTWDMSAYVTGPGTYVVTFSYTHGAHRLDIKQAELLAGDKVVATDAHAGATGARHENNTYRFNVTDPAQSKTWTLRAVVRSGGGTDSNGEITLVVTGQ